MKQFHRLRAIKGKSEDSLGRLQYAIDLANDLARYSEDESLVLGLFGDWGDGKTSAKNMVLEHYQSMDNPPIVLDFNPWQWSESGAIKSEFLRELCEKMGQSISDPSYVIAANLLEKYIKAIDKASDVSKFSGVTMSAFGLSALGPVLDLSLRALISKWFKTKKYKEAITQLRANDQDVRGAKELKGVLDAELKKVDRNIIVFIDDIDRLNPDEVLLMLQLVKSTLDFPRTIYVLIAQREYLIKCIAERYTQDYALQYLEKIVQIDLSLPRPSSDAIKKVFSEKIQKAMAGYISNVAGDPRHWGNLYQNGVECFFHNLRDVNRFLNSFQFILGQVTTKGVMEVNDADLIAIEVIRVFQPGLYRAVQSEKANLTALIKSDWHETLQGGTKEARLLERLLDTVASQYKEPAKEILLELFPNLRVTAGLSESWLEASNRLRIHHPDYFDRYFRLSLPETELSEGEVFHLSHLRGENPLLEAFESLRSRGVLFDGLHRLRKIASNVQHRDIADLATAAFCVVEKELPTLSRLSHLDSSAVILIIDLLRVHDRQFRFRVLSEIVKRTASIFQAVDLVSFAEPREDDIAFNREPLINDNELTLLKKQICEKLASLHYQNDLCIPSVNNGRLDFILYRWQDWNGNIPEDWYIQALDDSESLEFLLQGFIGDQRSTSVDQSVKIPETIQSKILQMKNFSKFVDMERIASAVKLHHNSLSKDTLGCFDAAYDRYKKGELNLPNEDDLD